MDRALSLNQRVGVESGTMSMISVTHAPELSALYVSVSTSVLFTVSGCRVVEAHMSRAHLEARLAVAEKAFREAPEIVHSTHEEDQGWDASGSGF